MSTAIKTIGVFTSGGDAPGMNAAIRAVVRAGIYYKLRVMGIHRGYEGMIDGEVEEMQSHDVSNILQRGGTILRTARSERFKTAEGRMLAFETLKKNGIDGLIAIGGDGTFRGALDFSKEFGIAINGIPGTIDNDLFGTDSTIGYDTAVNTALNAIDKIRDTADAHNRLFFIEVMGRDAGFIAISSGIGGGAEAILIPETKTDISALIEKLEQGWEKKKNSSIVIVAEGKEEGGAFEIARQVKERFNEYDTRVSVLGHMQRGGSPTCQDRVLASRLGVSAVEAMLEGRKNVMVGLVHREIFFTPFENAVKHHKNVNMNLLRIAEMLTQ
jgi:6-phosphofructokinase 1